MGEYQNKDFPWYIEQVASPSDLFRLTSLLQEKEITQR